MQDNFTPNHTGKNKSSSERDVKTQPSINHRTTE